MSPWQVGPPQSAAQLQRRRQQTRGCRRNRLQHDISPEYNLDEQHLEMASACLPLGQTCTAAEDITWAWGFELVFEVRAWRFNYALLNMGLANEVRLREIAWSSMLIEWRDTQRNSTSINTSSSNMLSLQTSFQQLRPPRTCLG